MSLNNFKIERKINGKTRVLFFVTYKDKRINNTNYARKYDAESLIKQVILKYGFEKLDSLVQNA
jgi:hypothetical protein